MGYKNIKKGGIVGMIILCVVATEWLRPEKLEDVLWVAVAAWGDSLLLCRTLKSICSQEESFWAVNVVVFEDVSSDMHRLGCYLGSSCAVRYIETGTTQSGGGFSKWALISYIRGHARPNEHVLFLDGDDVFSDSGVLRTVQGHLGLSKDWFVWGKIHGRYEEQCGVLPTLTGEFRYSALKQKKQTWPVCHPRVFKAGLLDYLSGSDFKRPNGEWLEKSTDRPFMFDFIELSGDDRVSQIGGRALVNYTWTKNNGLIVHKSATGSDKAIVNGYKKKERLEAGIVVIACVYERDNTATFFKHLSESRAGERIDIHICNNNGAEQGRLTRLGASMASEDVTITIHDMKRNTYGYGRFMVASALYESTMLDYFIMLDDDQYVGVTQLSELYSARRAQSYVCWYGKNWRPGNGDYWHADETYRSGAGVVSWQYGGTGMSVIDASILGYPNFLGMYYKYYDVEDMWLSYVVHRVGWRIGRFFTTMNVSTVHSKGGLWSGLREKKRQTFYELGM
jgi:hypothetical protein